MFRVTGRTYLPTSPFSSVSVSFRASPKCEEPFSLDGIDKSWVVLGVQARELGLLSWNGNNPHFFDQEGGWRFLEILFLMY